MSNPSVDYPQYLIEAIIAHREEIEAIKTRPNKPLREDTSMGGHRSTRTSESDSFEIRAHNARIPYNSNRRIEMLSVMTSDIDVAIARCLNEREQLTIVTIPFLKENGMTVTAEANAEYDGAILKLYAFLNFGYLDN